MLQVPAAPPRCPPMSTDPAGTAPAPACPICLEPILPDEGRRRRRVAWPGCRHPYHFACLARARAQVAYPSCALCRSPWQQAHDDTLSAACHEVGVNPFQDSEAEAPDGAPAVEASAPPAASAPANRPAPPQAMPAPALPWQVQGPPDMAVLAGANSWLYVPLLHAACGDLSAHAESAWSSAAPWWSEVRTHLASAPPVPASALLAAFAASSAAGSAAAAASLRAALAHAPPASLVHLSLAVRSVSDATGYIAATAQEVLLQIYGGLAFSSNLDRLSNTFRVGSAPPSAPAPARRARRRHQPTPRQPATPAAAAPAAVPVSDSDDSTCPRAASDEDVAPPASVPLPAASWAWLDSLDLCAELTVPIPTIRVPPRFLHQALTKAFLLPLRVLSQPRATEVQQTRAWTLFLLLPRLLLHRSPQGAQDGRAALLRRVDDFHAGRWASLHANSRSSLPELGSRLSAEGDEAASRRRRACAQVHNGDFSRARAILTGSPLAPGTPATLAALRDPARRPPHLLRPLSDVVLAAQPAEPLRLSSHEVAEALRTARRGAAPGPSGATIDLYKLLLEEEEALQLFTQAVNLLASAAVPRTIVAALARARLTALTKPTGGVRGIARGIATGDAFRRLTSRALARHFADTFDRATRPFQYALQTRAGTDAMAALLRLATDLDPTTTLVSLDGRSAYDSVSRAAILAKVHDVAPPLLPFVRGFYGHPSVYHWYDEAGRFHEIHQGEGIEQGDSLAPALFALAQHGALEAASRSLLPGETLLAFLDDVCVVTTPARARAAFDLVSRAIEAHAGISSNLGKTRVYHRAPGPPPPGIAALGPSVWVGDRPDAERGLVALGVPIGTADFIASHTATRLAEEEEFLAELPALPDLQAAWLLLSFCAAPRATHLLRTVPPSASGPYAEAHDAAVWRTLLSLLGSDADVPSTSRQLAFLPARLGGLGLFSAALVSPAAYWAGWVDAFAVLRERLPDVAAHCLQQLAEDTPATAACLRELAAAAGALDAAGWNGRPSWAALASSRPSPPPPLAESEPGVWRHGWQHSASLALFTAFRERSLLPALPPASQALLRSQSGAGAGAWLFAVPSDPGTALPPHHMLICLRRRLRLPLPLSFANCGQAAGSHGCGRPLDIYGDHNAACPRSGALPRRGHLLEQVWVRVCREALGPEGRVVPQQWLAATSAPGVSSADRRRLDFVLHGATPLGQALCCDATLVSPLTRDGVPLPRAATQDGIALTAAVQRKHRRYPELLRGGPNRFLVLGSEVGGRWSGDCQELLRLLVSVRCRRIHAAVRPAAASACRRRWWGLLSVGQQRALACTLLGGEWASPPQPADNLPSLASLLAEGEASAPSLLPLPGRS